MAWELLTTLVQRGDHQGSRSTVLSSLGWMAALLITGRAGSVSAHAAEWIPIFFATTLFFDFITFLGAYVYFARTNADALRIERFTLQKIAIQHGLLGDSSSGLFVPNKTQSPKLVTEPIIQIEQKNNV